MCKQSFYQQWNHTTAPRSYDVVLASGNRRRTCAVVRTGTSLQEAPYLPWFSFCLEASPSGMADVDGNPATTQPSTGAEDTNDGERNPIIFAIAIGAGFVGVVILTTCILGVVHSSRQRKKKVRAICTSNPWRPRRSTASFGLVCAASLTRAAGTPNSSLLLSFHQGAREESCAKGARGARASFQRWCSF